MSESKLTNRQSNHLFFWIWFNIQRLHETPDGVVCFGGKLRNRYSPLSRATHGYQLPLGNIADSFNSSRGLDGGPTGRRSLIGRNGDTPSDGNVPDTRPTTTNPLFPGTLFGQMRKLAVFSFSGITFHVCEISR